MPELNDAIDKPWRLLNVLERISIPIENKKQGHSKQIKISCWATRKGLRFKTHIKDNILTIERIL